MRHEYFIFLLKISAQESVTAIEQMCTTYIPTDMETQKSQEYWPAEEDFVEEPEIQKWRDLPKGIYCIKDYESK